MSDVKLRLVGDNADFKRELDAATKALSQSVNKMADAAGKGFVRITGEFDSIPGAAKRAAGGTKSLVVALRGVSDSADNLARVRSDIVAINAAAKLASGSADRLSTSVRNVSAKGLTVIRRDMEGVALSSQIAANKTAGLITTLGGIALGGGGLTALAKSAVSAADNIAKTSLRLGITTDELQRYRFAAELSGVATATFDQAFQRFGRRIGEAAQGTGEAKDALKALQINVTNLDGSLRPVNEVFDEAITKLADVEDVTIRNALAMKLFDSEGVALVQIGGKLQELKQKADDLGIIIPEEILRNAENLNDQLTIVSKTLQLKLTAAVIRLAPQLNKLADGALFLAENFDTIVEAAVVMAKVLVGIKLVSFANTLYTVGAASIVAARGVGALNLALRGLKIATIVGALLVALEVIISNFIDSVDTSMDEINKKIEQASKDIAEATQEAADSQTKGLSAAVRARAYYNQQIDRLLKNELAALNSYLVQQKKILAESEKSLDRSASKVQKAGDEFRAAFDKIRNAGKDSGDLNFIDLFNQIRKAQKELDKGNFEKAIEESLKAKDIVEQIAEAGETSGIALEGALKKAQEVQTSAANSLLTSNAKAIDQAKKAVQQIQSQINLISSITFDFDEVGSLEGARALIEDIKRIVRENPIVVPVVLQQPGGIDLDGGDVNAPGFAQGGFIRGPGTATSDSILARLSNGEYVMPANVVRYFGRDFFDELRRRRLPAFATGGLVQTKAPTQSGNPVTLNLDGRSYKMTADNNTTKDLRRAVQIQALKTGRKQT
ncbi:Methyl-accepting chemotaxis protein [Hahella chejuensis KCTC 2396]|uniref:Methyl-accepting chemotaxis protein n=1 Tax=Hahella chejuensis (strain KCTC 2396) TaxID=349521 RepID=Q2SI45_HAHCH|nr:hypothetical protein [Hahella chejuensis]ABC29679.1 Methyl-accepting chemotaxis protein [Hahella chejuensis KCTC 2396]